MALEENKHVAYQSFFCFVCIGMYRERAKQTLCLCITVNISLLNYLCDCTVFEVILFSDLVRSSFAVVVAVAVFFAAARAVACRTIKVASRWGNGPQYNVHCVFLRIHDFRLPF